MTPETGFLNLSSVRSNPNKSSKINNYAAKESSKNRRPAPPPWGNTGVIDFGDIEMDSQTMNTPIRTHRG